VRRRCLHFLLSLMALSACSHDPNRLAPIYEPWKESADPLYHCPHHGLMAGYGGQCSNVCTVNVSIVDFDTKTATTIIREDTVVPKNGVPTTVAQSVRSGTQTLTTDELSQVREEARRLWPKSTGRTVVFDASGSITIFSGDYMRTVDAYSNEASALAAQIGKAAPRISRSVP
jgi:hypothetical protein